MYDTLALQRELHTLGYNPGLPDGVMGPRTRSALIAFQRDNGVVPDGIPGQKTAAALARELWRYRKLSREQVVQARLLLQTRGDDLGISGVQLRELVQEREYPWSNVNGWVNLVGLRGFTGDRANGNTFDRYNDTLILALNEPGKHDEDLPNIRLYQFTASVDPGLLKKPKPEGVAHLLPGHYRYRLGLHHQREEALVQAARVTIARFFDPLQPQPGQQASESKNQPRLPKRETGWFGIHIHRGGMGLKVGEWSAGCQVIQGNQWPLFLSLVKEAGNAGQQEFGYTLLNGAAVQQANLEQWATATQQGTFVKA